MHRRTEKPKPICSSLNVGGIKTTFVQHHDDFKKLLVSQCYIPGAIYDDEQNCIICTPMQFKCFNI